MMVMNGIYGSNPVPQFARDILKVQTVLLDPIVCMAHDCIESTTAPLDANCNFNGK